MAEYYPRAGICYDHDDSTKIYLVYTFRCTAECGHCLVESSPRRREKFAVDETKQLLETAAEFGKRFLMFSGGEALIYRKEILELARFASTLGYTLTLNTNAFWAKSPELTLRVLSELADAGISAIFPSASTYHLRYVPIERVRNVREACRELGLLYELNFFDSDEAETDRFIKDYLDLDTELYFFDGLTNAANDAAVLARLERIYPRRTPAELDDCRSVHMSMSPIGHVVMTCNMTYRNTKYLDTPFFLGDFRREGFAELLRRERSSPVLQYLYANPFPALHDLLDGHDVLGEHYRATFSERRYYNVIDYYIDVFRDPLVGSSIESVLAAELDRAPADAVAAGS